MRYVQKGKRTRDFAKWVRDRKGEAAIFSMHGTQAKDEDQIRNKYGHHELILSDSKEHKWLQRRNDPFAPNRMNLDFYVTEKSPPNCYTGKLKHDNDYHPPNLWQLGCRAMRLGFNFAPVISTVGFAILSKRFREGTWYPWLASCIGNSGAAWIKWGQWTSTRNDMFPEALCDQLAQLHSDAPAHSWGFSEEIMESSLGLAEGTLNQVFEEFDQAPLASGSIAQVHRAVLDGNTVAVKIRHPNVARLIDMDFRLMTALARVFDWIPALSWLHIRESVEQFSHTMAAQSYLNVEAHHLEVLNHNFRRWPQVRFPQPLYSSPACIIESFEQGKIVTSIISNYNELAEDVNVQRALVNVEEPDDTDDPINNSKPEDDNKFLEGHQLMPVGLAKFLVTTGLGLYLKMLLVDNLMHADLHPGNIMLDMHPSLPIPRPIPATTAHGAKLAVVPAVKARRSNGSGVTLVDAGMVAQLTDDESATFIGLLASVGEGNGRDAAIFSLQFSVENNMTEEEREAFITDMEELFAERCRGYGTNVDVGFVLRGILGLIRKHHVRIDANFATLCINCLCLQSLAEQVCPDYNLLDFARPLLQSYRRMCYERDGTPKPEARSSKWVNFWLRLMYLRKAAAENRFFRRWAREKKKAGLPILGQPLS